ncbi:MAG: hypothetical protein V2A54_12545 [Bacteroidota bacterium]
MALTRVLITVKTYPTLSGKHEESVCTAGIREDGSWIRIYPVPFRKKPFHEQYKKFDFIEMDIVKNEGDFRPESFRPALHDTEIRIVEHLGTENDWEQRKRTCLQNVHIDMEALIESAKNPENHTSLAVFKPAQILNFSAIETDREWDRAKLEKLNQLNLFERTTRETSEVVQKLPYKFTFTFVDCRGKESTLMIEDWEIGQLYWNCLAKHRDEQKAIDDVRKKYFDLFTKKKDLYFFLGTTLAYHNRSKNPFMIIGVFYPPIQRQLSLFD